MDALNDQLIEEKKKSRDLQWAMEKEKCRTGRTEESKREELEVRKQSSQRHLGYFTVYKGGCLN